MHLLAILSLVDYLAVLTSDKAAVTRVISADEVIYYITRENGSQFKLIKSHKI